MWDRSGAQTFTREEANQLIGKTVKTSANRKTMIKGMFCDGPNSYILEDEKGHMLYKCHNNCPYILR